jgi:hypothetical protein
MTLPNELAWIPDLVRGVFFAPCERHSAGSKGEQVNLFSVSGRRAMCAACAAETSVKDAIQVRRARDETWIFYARASFRSRPSSFFASRVSGAPMRRNAGRQVSRLDSSEV